MDKKRFIRTAVARHPPSKSVTLSETKEWPQNEPNLGSAAIPNEINRLTAENERLRAALKDIAAWALAETR